MAMLKSYDIACMVIDDVSKEHSEKPGAREAFKTLCGEIDMFRAKFNAKAISFDVDERTMEIITEIDCEDFEAKRGDTICSIIADSNWFSLKVSPEDSEGVQVTLRFSGIWNMES